MFLNVISCTLNGWPLTILWLRCISSFSVAAARALRFLSESRAKADLGSGWSGVCVWWLTAARSVGRSESNSEPPGAGAWSRLNGFNFFTMSIATENFAYPLVVWFPRFLSVPHGRRQEIRICFSYLATSRQYDNALLGVRHSEEEEIRPAVKPTVAREWCIYFTRTGKALGRCSFSIPLPYCPTSFPRYPCCRRGFGSTVLGVDFLSSV